MSCNSLSLIFADDIDDGDDKQASKWTFLNDPTEVFSCHGIGGVAGSLLVGLFAKVTGQDTIDGSFYGNGSLIVRQIAAVAFTIAYSSIVTLMILALLHFTIGLDAQRFRHASQESGDAIGLEDAHKSNGSRAKNGGRHAELAI